MSYRHHGGRPGAYGASQGRGDRGRPMPEKAQVWVLTKPPNVPELSSTLGIPGFFRLKGTEREDKLTEEQIKMGYKEPYFAGLEREYWSMRQQICPHASSIKTAAVENLEQLFYLKEMRAKQAKAREKFLNYKIRQQVPLFPPLQASMVQQKDAFVRDLADPALRLFSLAPRVPHGYNPQTLLEALVEHQVPIPRAMWFVKVFFLNKLCKPDGTLLDRSKPSISTTWTTFLVKSIRDKAAAAFMPSSGLRNAKSSGGEDDEEQEIGKRRHHLIYLTSLLHFSISEELVDSASLCASLVDAVSDKGSELDSYFVNLCAEHAMQLIRNPSSWHKLVAICYGLIRSKHVHVADDKTSALNESFRRFLSRSAKASPDIVASLEDDVYVELSEFLQPSELIDIQRLRDQVRQPQMKNCDPVTQLNHAMCQTANITLDLLWLSLFANKSKIWTNKGIDEFAQRTVWLVCEWAARDVPSTGSQRFLLAASIISQTHSRILYEFSRNQRHSGSEISYPLEHTLLDFIDKYEPQSDSEWEAVVKLFASLLRARVVSYVRYMRTLSTRGILDPAPISIQKPDPHAAKHIRILSALPIFGKQDKLRERRFVALSSNDDKIVKEKEFILNALEKLQFAMNSAGHPVLINDNLNSLCAFLASAPSLYAKSVISEWLFNHVASSLNSLSTSPQSLRMLLFPVIVILETLGDVETLSSLLLYVLHHSNAIDTIVLNTLSYYQFAYFMQRRILAVLIVLHSKLSGVSPLSANEPLKARIAYLVALWLLRYAHLPEVSEWKEKVAILDMAVQSHLDRLNAEPEQFQLVASPSPTTVNSIGIVLAPYIDPKASSLLPLSIQDDVAVVSSLKLANDPSSTSAVLSSLISSLSQISFLSQEIIDSFPVNSSSSVIVMNALHVVRGLSYALPHFHASSLLPLNVLHSVVRTELRNSSFNRARARALGMVVWMLLWEGAVALDELLERVLTPEASDKSLSEPVALLYRTLFVEAQAILGPLFNVPIKQLRLGLSRLKAGSVKAVVEAIRNLRKALFPLDLPLKYSWIGNMLISDPELLFSCLENIGEPCEARAFYHEHLRHSNGRGDPNAIKIEGSSNEVTHISGKEDAENVGRKELEIILNELNAWNTDSAWLSLRLLLDEWLGALSDSDDRYCAISSFTTTFMRYIIDSVESSERGESLKGKRAVSILPMEPPEATKRLCTLFSRLRCTKGIISFLKAIVEAEEWSKNEPFNLVGVAANVIAHSVKDEKRDDAFEAALVYLLRSVADDSRKDFSFEQSIADQLDKIRTSIAALSPTAFADSVPCALVNHANAFLRLSIPLIRTLVGNASAQTVREHLACAVVRLVCTERYLERTTVSMWSFALHVYGALVAPESERFSSGSNTKQERIHFRRTVIETLTNCTLPYAYRERIEQVAPAFQPKASARPSTNLPDGVDPWVVLDDHPEPLLMGKIIKGAPQEREELTLAGAIITASSNLIGKRKAPPEGSDEPTGKKARTEASTPGTAKTPAQPLFPASPTSPPNELEINSPSPIPPRPPGPPAKETQFDSSLSQLSQPDYSLVSQSQLHTQFSHDYATQTLSAHASQPVQYSTQVSGQLPPRPPPSAQRRADLSRLTRPVNITSHTGGPVPPRPSPIKRLTDPQLRHTTNPLRRSRGKH